MSPKSDPKTAAGWRRTKHLEETLALVQYLDGTRRLPEAAKLAGVHEQTAWRILAVLRYLADKDSSLVSFEERREGRTAFHAVRLLPALDE
jgi:hypothetical protein